MYSTGSMTQYLLFSAAAHERINHPVVTRRLTQSTNIHINRSSLNNDNLRDYREIYYHMLHVLATMANLSSHLLRYDDVVSAHSDGNLVEELHIFMSQWFQDLNHLSDIILNNTKNVISSSDTWERLYNR